MLTPIRCSFLPPAMGASRTAPYPFSGAATRNCHIPLPLTDARLRALRSALWQTTRSGTAAGVFEGFDMAGRPIGAKTGTAEVDGSQTTSWLATFDDRYVVVMMVGQGGTGSGTSGAAVRDIWEVLRR